jgi:hypothetical protein
MAVSIKNLPPSPATQPNRRMGRRKLVFVRHRRINPRSAELDPETTRSTDQKLTELAFKGANSDNNTAILREREKALDRWTRKDSQGLSQAANQTTVSQIRFSPEQNNERTQ